MRDRWPGSVAALHWLSALLIVSLAAAGFVMTDLPAASGGRLLLSRMHTLAGALLMVLTLARLVARAAAPSVAPLAVPLAQRRLAGAVHALLYAVTLVLGASGFVTGATSAWPEYLRGALAEAPALEALASRQAHEALALALMGLVLLHVAGVGLRQRSSGDALRRMVPFLK